MLVFEHCAKFTFSLLKLSTSITTGLKWLAMSNNKYVEIKMKTTKMFVLPKFTGS